MPNIRKKVKRDLEQKIVEVFKHQTGKGITIDLANSYKKAVFTAVKALAMSGKPVTIKEFGRFRVAETKERPGRNPQTGEPLTIHAHKVMKFKASGAGVE